MYVGGPVEQWVSEWAIERNAFVNFSSYLGWDWDFGILGFREESEDGENDERTIEIE